MPKAEAIRIRLEPDVLARLDAEVTRLQALSPAIEANRSTVVRAALAEYLKKEEPPVKKFVMNLKDASGNIRTGYEETLKAQTADEAVTDYLHFHKANTDENITTDDIECVEVDWE